MTILSPYEPKLLQCLQKQRAASILAVALLLSSSAFGRNVIIFVADGLRYARKSGFATAAIGKLGPTLIQDIVAGCAKDGSIALPDTVIIDDMTGKEGGVPLDPKIASELKNAGLDLIAPDRSNGQPKTQEDNEQPGNQHDEEWRRDRAFKIFHQQPAGLRKIAAHFQRAILQKFLRASLGWQLTHHSLDFLQCVACAGTIR